jgi:hypothetical protein
VTDERPDQSGAPEGGPGQGAPTDEELRAALEEQMRRISVQEVILQTVVTLVNLASRRLGLGGGEDAAAERDLEQARLGIEAVRALLPLCPPEQAAPVRDALSQLQMVFAREAQTASAPGAGPAAATGGGGEQKERPPAGGKEPAEEAERAKARSKIWTPPGS